MPQSLTSWFNHYFNPFASANATVAAQRQLSQAKLDLLEAEAAAEHWTALSAMLRARIRRLEGTAK